jgi:hypothetical protein
MQLSERILLIVTAIITAVSTLFCLIALASPGWYLSYFGSANIGLYCTGCPTAPKALSIIAFLLLILGIVVLVLFALNILPKSIQVLSVFVLFLATMFTLAAYASSVDKITGYSFKLMVFAHFLCYIATLFVAFWLGGSYATTVVTPTNP